MGQITTAARRIQRQVNEDYGKFHVMFFDADGHYVAQARKGHRAMIRALRKWVAAEPRPRQLIHNGRKP